MANEKHLETKKVEGFIKKINPIVDQLAAIGIVITTKDLSQKRV